MEEAEPQSSPPAKEPITFPEEEPVGEPSRLEIEREKHRQRCLGQGAAGRCTGSWLSSHQWRHPAPRAGVASCKPRPGVVTDLLRLPRRSEKFGTEYREPERRQDLRLDARKERFKREGFATGIDLFTSVRLAAPLSAAQHIAPYDTERASGGSQAGPLPTTPPSPRSPCSASGGGVQARAARGAVWAGPRVGAAVPAPRGERGCREAAAARGAVWCGVPAARRDRPHGRRCALCPLCPLLLLLLLLLLLEGGLALHFIQGASGALLWAPSWPCPVPHSCAGLPLPHHPVQTCTSSGGT